MLARTHVRRNSKRKADEHRATEQVAQFQAKRRNWLFKFIIRRGQKLNIYRTDNVRSAFGQRADFVLL